MKKEIITIEYQDAHYSYEDNTEPPLEKIKSRGRIVAQTDKYVDIETSWTDNPHIIKAGIVIPQKLLEIKIKTFDIKKDKYSTNDSVAVYWNDIFAYDDKYNGPHTTTPMITEGKIIQETDSYVIIEDPETLNLTDAVNHPQKKPKRYFIPKAMIDEIRKVTKK